MSSSFIILLPILVPLGVAFILPIVERVAHYLRSAVCIGAMLISLAALLSIAEPVFNGTTLVYWMSGWTPRDGLAIGINLSVDAWSLLIALVVAVVGLMSLIYTPVYLRNESGREPFYVLTMLLLAALTGFCLSGDLFNQFVWLEVFSVSSFALTGFHFETRSSVEAAFKYLITNSVSAFFIVLGLTLLYMQTGALNLAHIARDFRPTPAGLVAVGLLIGGYATKAALVPWHFWLPDAHSLAFLVARCAYRRAHANQCDFLRHLAQSWNLRASAYHFYPDALSRRQPYSIRAACRCWSEYACWRDSDGKAAVNQTGTGVFLRFPNGLYLARVSP